MEKKKKSESAMTFIEVHRRKQIIETAINIIARDGYQQATLASVAKEAGFTKGVIFYYFKNKDELIVQINEVLLEELRDYTRQRVRNDATPSENLKTYIQAYFDFVKENRDKFAILTELGINLNLKTQDPIFGSYTLEHCRQSVHALLGKDNTLEQIDPKTADTLSAIIQGLLDGVGIQYLADPEAVDLDSCYRVTSQMIDSFLKDRS